MKQRKAVTESTTGFMLLVIGIILLVAVIIFIVYISFGSEDSGGLIPNFLKGIGDFFCKSLHAC